LAVIEITTFLVSRSDADTIELRAKAPRPASGGRLIWPARPPATA